jgi:hypothetical protein
LIPSEIYEKSLNALMLERQQSEQVPVHEVGLDSISKGCQLNFDEDVTPKTSPSMCK